MILKNMGTKWVYHRLLHSFKLKTNYFNYIEKRYSNIESTLDFEQTRTNFKEFKKKNSMDKSELSKLSEIDKKKIIAKADKVVNNEFEYYFHDIFKFENVNWHYNPYIKKEIPPHRKWYQIPTHDLSNGDIKDYWELNRFVFVYDLINAYSLTTDEKYVAKFIELTKDWIENNPYEYGVNYKCSQETSFRCLNWLMGILHLDLIEKHPSTTDIILTSILKQSYHVKSLMSYSVNCVKNNHTLNEALFLYVVGSYFSFNHSKLFTQYGIKIYNESLNDQILTDGSYIQNSHTYHRVMLLSAVMFKYFEKNSGDLNLNSMISLKKATDFMKYFIMDNGDMPNYGPNDGSVPFNFIASDYRDFRPIVDMIHTTLYGHQHFNTANHHINAWFIRFISDSSKKRVKISPKKSSMYFREGGYLILKNNNKTLFMRIKNGKRRPGQSDNNSIDLWNYNQNLLIDTGTYKYTTEESIIDYFKGSIGHNYLRINQQEPMKRISKFMYSNWSKSEIVELKTNDNSIRIRNVDYKNFDIERSLQLNNNLIIRDTFHSHKNEEYNVELFFHLNSQPKIVSQGNSKLVFNTVEGNSLEFLSEEILNYELFYGNKNPFRGWKSTHYNKLTKSYQLIIKLNSDKDSYIETKYIFKEEE